jgi:hypothetical protein
VKKYHFIFCFLLLAIVILSIFFRTWDSKRSDASSTTFSLSSSDEWNSGDKSNILVSSGTFGINDKGSSNIDLVSYVAANPGTITASTNAENVNNLIDGNTSSFWGIEKLIEDPTQYGWIQIDLGQNYQVVQGRVFVGGIDSDYKYQISSNGTDFTDLTSYTGGFNHWGQPDWFINNISGNGRYLRISTRLLQCEPMMCAEPKSKLNLQELELAVSGFGVHTSGATQIDGGANFWSWDSNTIAQSVPANTTATYQYRTSVNGADWTGWVESIGSVTNRTGDDSSNPTRYRYLQIKATLTNTDGASTPTIDSYTIGYHTEVKPSAPSAQTAVVQ